MGGRWGRHYPESSRHLEGKTITDEWEKYTYINNTRGQGGKYTRTDSKAENEGSRLKTARPKIE